MNRGDGEPAVHPAARRDAAPGDEPATGRPDDDGSPDTTDPTTDRPDPSEVPTDLRVTFWSLVFVIKFAVIATALGILFVLFEGRVQFGGGLVGLGVVLFLFALVRYRRYRASQDDARTEASE